MQLYIKELGYYGIPVGSLAGRAEEDVVLYIRDVFNDVHIATKIAEVYRNGGNRRIYAVIDILHGKISVYKKEGWWGYDE